MATEALLFQTGYLTIAGEADLAGEPLYRLSYPNREVRQSLNESLLRYLVKDATRQVANSVRLYELPGDKRLRGLKTLFQAFFSSIPYEWYTNNDIADYEGYYASVFYSYFAALGLDITVEDSTSHGRLDMAVRFGGNVYLFEFKVVELEPKGDGDGAAEGEALSRTSTWTGAGRCSWLVWSSARWRGTWWGLRWGGGEVGPARTNLLRPKHPEPEMTGKPYRQGSLELFGKLDFQQRPR